MRNGGSAGERASIPGRGSGCERVTSKLNGNPFVQGQLVWAAVCGSGAGVESAVQLAWPNPSSWLVIEEKWGRGMGNLRDAMSGPGLLAG